MDFYALFCKNKHRKKETAMKPSGSSQWGINLKDFSFPEYSNQVRINDFHESKTDHKVSLYNGKISIQDGLYSYIANYNLRAIQF